MLITLLVTLASLASASIRRYPDFSAVQWHAVLLAHLTAVAVRAGYLGWHLRERPGASRGQGRLPGGPRHHHAGRYRRG